MDKGFLRIGKWFFKPQDLDEKSLGSRSVHVSHVLAKAPLAQRSHASELDVRAPVCGWCCSSGSQQRTGNFLLINVKLGEIPVVTPQVCTFYLKSHNVVRPQWEEGETQQNNTDLWIHIRGFGHESLLLRSINEYCLKMAPSLVSCIPASFLF